MKAVISLENMRFFAYHGCYNEEAVVGNHYEVHLRMRADVTRACETDDVQDTLNYQRVYALVAEQMRVRSHLLEHVASRILGTLFGEFATLEWAQVKVRKLGVPLGGQVEASAVEMEQERKDQG